MKSKTAFVCKQCGNETPRWQGQCPACGAWNSIVEFEDKKAPAAKAAGRAGIADGVNEAPLRAAIGGQVLDQQNAVRLVHAAFDPGVAAVALGLLAHIGHRQAQPFGDHGAEGDAGGFTACHIGKRLKPGITQYGRGHEIHQRAAHAGIGDDAPAIHIGRPLQARSIGEGLGRVEIHGLDFQQCAGGQAGDFFGGGKGQAHAGSDVQNRGKPGSKTVTVSSPAAISVGNWAGLDCRVRRIRSAFGAMR